MTESSTDMHKSQLNYISSSLCSISASANDGFIPSRTVFPNSQNFIEQNSSNIQAKGNLEIVQFPNRLDTLSSEMRESYARVLKENKDVLMLLAE